MKKQPKVSIQCENQILLKALRQLLEKTQDIQVISSPDRQDSAEKEVVEFIVREEDEQLRQWLSSLDLNGKIHLYVHPNENWITITTSNRVQLQNVSELADLIVHHHEQFFNHSTSEENHKGAS